MADLFLNIEAMAVLSHLLPIILFLIFYGKLSGLLKRFLLILITLAAFKVVEYLTGYYSIHNLLIYTCHFICEFYLISFFFKKLLPQRRFQLLINAMMLLFIVVIILNIKRIINLSTFDSYDAAFTSFIIIIYCLFYFHHQLSQPQIIFIYKSHWFWIVTALLFYYSGSFLIYLSTNYIMWRDLSVSMGLWDILFGLTIIENILFAISIYYIPKNSLWKPSL